ncbi:uridine kinase family protein [Aquipuribacter sp. SD81]|uniref:uridine kinase family protein n=1 Tax=Aquipuribacter sp. SD81 TaxID=3127703 RepID=UPI003019F1D4
MPRPTDGPPRPRARVLLLAGASGSGKTTLVERLRGRHEQVTVVQLDDFYRDHTDPGLPAWGGIVDWDDPASWDVDAAEAALRRLCADGRCEVPVYDIPTSRATGHRPVTVGPGGLVVAEGLFAPELVARLRGSDVLLDAVHLRSRPAVTFVRRLARDLAGHRKPPLTLLRRGVALARQEPGLLRRWTACGTRPVTKAEVEGLVARHLDGVRA